MTTFSICQHIVTKSDRGTSVPEIEQLHKNAETALELDSVIFQNGKGNNNTHVSMQSNKAKVSIHTYNRYFGVSVISVLPGEATVFHITLKQFVVLFLDYCDCCASCSITDCCRCSNIALWGLF